jgi:GntR family transcriptional regulator
VPLYSPALLFERTTRDQGGRTVEHARSIYRGDRYRITNHLTFDPESG